MIVSIDRIPTTELSRMADMIKCIGHPLRLRLLEALEQGERSVSELRERLRVPQSVVSQQLAVLRGRGVVESRRQGAHVYYRLVEPRVTVILDCIRGCAPGEPAA